MSGMGIRRFLTMWAICAALVCWSGLAGAQGDEHNTLDLTECIRRALELNPRMEEALLDVTKSRWKLKSAQLERTPRMEVLNVMGMVQDAKGDAITGDSIDDHYGFFNKMDMEFALPIYTFGRLSRGIDAARQGVEAKEASVEKAREDLIRRVKELYYGLVLARQMRDSTREIQENFTEARDIAEERLEKGEGTVAETDVLKLRIGLAGVTEGLRKIERETLVTREALREAIGMEEGANLNLADERLKPVDFQLKPLDEYLARAEFNNPDLKQLKAGVEATKAEYLSEKSKFYPSVLIVGGIRHAEAPGREDQDNPFLNDDFNYFKAGGAVAFKWNMNLFQTNAEVQEKKTDYLRMESRLRHGMNGILLNVKDKFYKVEEKKAGLETSFEARKSGRALLVLTMTNFKFGIGSGKDVFDALGVYARTAGKYYEAVYEYNMAVAELKSAVGEGYDAERFQAMEASQENGGVE